MDKNKEMNFDNDIANRYDNVEVINISGEIKDSFLDYAMSVIIARALPDAKDGMKPVQRRILYGMNGMGNYANTPYRKSARIVGEVMGKYHPHGDSSIYDAMVRMAQTFSYRYPLVDGHGNFGSVDGDGAAAPRYTEARMSKISMELLRDIQKNTVDFIDNYDGEEQEPTVLPARFPNLLVNGSYGIAVGMATNMPPHNLREAIDAVKAIIHDPNMDVVELMNKYIPGPDFPTGGLIVGRAGIRRAYEKGKGTIFIRSKADIIETDNGKHEIIIKEIPYGVNKLALYRSIINLAKDKVVDGIINTADESNMNGIKIIIECRKDVQPEVLLNQLYRKTQLQISYGINMLALVDNSPRVLPIRELIQVYIDHQIDIIQRRVKYDLQKALDRAHILEGLIIAIDNVDEIVEIIKTSANDSEALNRLIERFNLSEIQAQSILDMQMKRLTGLQRQKILDEYNQLEIAIADYTDILNRHERVIEIIEKELDEIKEKYGDERKTEIIDSEDLDIEDEDLIPVEDVVVSISNNGYIKRTTLDTFKTQKRGGKGIKGMGLNSDDMIDQMINMSTHDDLLLFSNLGKVYRIKGYKVPASGRNAKGIPVINLLCLDKNEKIQALIDITPDESLKDKFLFFATKKGLVKKCSMNEFIRILKNGKKAIRLNENDELFTVVLTNGNDDVIVATDNGLLVRFSEQLIRKSSRISGGVKGIKVGTGEVVGLGNCSNGKYVLVISENGFGKMTPIEEFRKTGRNGKGSIAMKVRDKNGKMISAKIVNGNEDLLLMNTEGLMIRISLSNVRITGRNSQGVILFRSNDAKVASASVIDNDIDEQQDTENELDIEDKSKEIVAE